MEKQFWSPRARALTPYVPGEQPQIEGLIKLNTNENPYPPSPKALAAMEQALGASLRLYPDPSGSVLRESVVRQYGLTAQQVFVGNGSDEVLSLAFCALFDPDKAVRFPSVSYSFYPVYADYYALRCEFIPMQADFSICPEDFYDSKGGVVLANPNAPTGIALSRMEIRGILEHNRHVPVIIDEAYVDFGAESAVPLLSEFPNLLVVHTLSKYRSLAGLRVGYAMGQESLIAALTCVKDSFNSYPLDRIALAGAAAAVEDAAYYTQCAQQVIATRTRTVEQLETMGFAVCPSSANFVFAMHPDYEGAWLFEQLRTKKILVRHWKKPNIASYLRITIGTDEEMQVLFAALRQILQ